MQKKQLSQQKVGMRCKHEDVSSCSISISNNYYNNIHEISSNDINKSEQSAFQTSRNSTSAIYEKEKSFWTTIAAEN